MVTPAFLAAASDEIMKLYADLEDAIKTDMCRRLASLGRISTSTDWQAKILREAGSLGGDIGKYLTSYDKKTQRTVKELFKQLTARATSGEIAPNQQQMIAATQGYTGLITDLHNLTRTSAATTEFVIAANNLYIQVASGAFSYTEALKSTVDALAAKGLYTLSYGDRSYNIESMARTCVQTALGQTAGRQSMAEAEATGTDLVMVSAHEGARHTDKPANPWSNHDEWQGKVYCTAGEREYRDEAGNVHLAPDFYAATGYGEIDGLCGINCRHTFYPYYEGEAERYDREELEDYRKADLTLDGKKVTRYEAEQELRSTERMIRGWKRKAQCQQEAGLDDTAARIRLGAWQERRASICKQTGLRPDWTREYIGTPDGKQPRGLQPPRAAAAPIPAPAAPAAAAPTTTGAIKTAAQAQKVLVSDVGFQSVAASFKKYSEEVQITNTSQIRTLEKKFKAVGQSTGEINGKSGRDPGTLAFVSSGVVKPAEQDLSLCPREFSKPQDQIAAHTKDMISKRWFMPCKSGNEGIYIVTHEYGHMIQNILVKKEFERQGLPASDPFRFYDSAATTKRGRLSWYLKTRKNFENKCKKEIIDIAKKIDKNFNYNDNISRYGDSNPAEFFAEVFANSQLGASNTLGKAMQRWLADHKKDIGR